MKVKVELELTASLIDILSIEQAKAILLQVISEIKPEETGLSGNGIVSPEKDMPGYRFKTSQIIEDNDKIVKKPNKFELHELSQHNDKTDEIQWHNDKIEEIQHIKVFAGNEVIENESTVQLTDDNDISHWNQIIPNHVIKDIQTRYDNNEGSLMKIVRDNYPDLNYRTVYGLITLKKK